VNLVYLGEVKGHLDNMKEMKAYMFDARPQDNTAVSL